jgi:hypothetical protein
MYVRTEARRAVCVNEAASRSSTKASTATTELDDRYYQNWEVRAGGVGKWASSSPMLEKKRPVRLLPLITGTLEGAIHPMSPNPITFRSRRSQSRGNLSHRHFQHRTVSLIRAGGRGAVTHVMQVTLPFLSRFLVISGFLAETRRPPLTKPAALIANPRPIRYNARTRHNARACDDVKGTYWWRTPAGWRERRRRGRRRWRRRPCRL